MATRMQQRRGTAAQWATANPVLADGEIGYERDTRVFKMGDGVSTWSQLHPILESNYLPVNGKAYDSDRLDGYDSSAFAKFNDLAAYNRDRGSGATWPTTGNQRGDWYYHTAVSQLGVYDGTAWKLIGVGTVATTTARDALTWMYPKMQVRVTADNNVYEYQNSTTGWTQPWDRPWGLQSEQTDPTVGSTTGVNIGKNQATTTHFLTPYFKWYKNRKYLIQAETSALCTDVSGTPYVCQFFQVVDNPVTTSIVGSSTQQTVHGGNGRYSIIDLYLNFRWTPAQNYLNHAARMISYTTYAGASAITFDVARPQLLTVIDLGPAGLPA